MKIKYSLVGDDGEVLQFDWGGISELKFPVKINERGLSAESLV